MTTALPLFTAPIARSTDPATSHAACAEIRPKLSTLESRFVETLRLLGDSTALEVAVLCVETYGGLAETYRKRAAVCLRHKAIERVGVRNCGITGKPATTYRVTGAER